MLWIILSNTWMQIYHGLLRTPFEAIKREFGLNESAVIRLMRQNLKLGSFKLWRERVAGRKTKHLQLRSSEVIRGYCTRQYKHH
ncbi:TIGR03643 family protein [Acinetobacter bohemicus]|jgi:uncharacterized protein (TIGR03643 family)|uniref:TIGR03643 family protein n=1 Tax=Acinetobacter bohemicus TaxID=1435036 RepID=A0A1I6WII3_9GAMM|nr:TIGR03643 family protein [Acinetobacter bohemicus]SFT25802.1 TIGR03643 family protein [Acinetobacter bohemicus]